MAFKKTISLLKQLAQTKHDIVDRLKTYGIEASFKESFESLLEKSKEIGVMPSTFILQDENGNELLATVANVETIFTATSNDIRKGTVAATDAGVTEGMKEIPAYHTTEGHQFVPVGSEVVITNLNNCEYTKLQVLLCVFNSTIAKSVATEKVCIDGNVYAVGSTDSVATVTIDTSRKSVSLGFTNDGASPLIIRYFTYKEIY